ncbi:MAG: hypothetical protein JSR77_01940 [Planctomycetes bacterium]|nr:hypothetical protein [Planctomycetota bacterium]
MCFMIVLAVGLLAAAMVGSRGMTQSGTTSSKTTPAASVGKFVETVGGAPIATRPRWPVGSPLFVRFDATRFAASVARLVDVRSDLPGSVGASLRLPAFPLRILGQPKGGPLWDDGLIEMGTPTSARSCVRFDVVCTELNDGATPSTRSPAHTYDVDVDIAGTVDDVMGGVEIPEIEAALKEELGATFFIAEPGADDVSRLWLNVNSNCERDEEPNTRGLCCVLSRFADVTLAVRIELMLDDRVVGWASAWWRDGGGRVTPGVEMVEVHLSGRLPPRVGLSADRWRCRITSDPGFALRDFASKKYWKGSVVSPVKVVDEREGDAR